MLVKAKSVVRDFKSLCSFYTYPAELTAIGFSVALRIVLCREDRRLCAYKKETYSGYRHEWHEYSASVVDAMFGARCNP